VDKRNDKPCLIEARDHLVQTGQLFLRKFAVSICRGEMGINTVDREPVILIELFYKVIGLFMPHTQPAHPGIDLDVNTDMFTRALRSMVKRLCAGKRAHRRA